MREIASFEDERSAKRFADVLCARDIDTELSQKRDGGFSVWVLEEKHFEASRAAWAAFDAAPDAPEHVAARGCVEQKQQRYDQEHRRSRHEVIDVRRSFHPPADGGLQVTLFLIITSVMVTVLVSFANRPELSSRLLIGTQGMPPFFEVLHGQVWRLVTPIFVHHTPLHIIFNMWWLFNLGNLLERRLGGGRFGLLVLVTAALSNVAQYLIDGPGFGGMSGVIYALLGYCWVRGRLEPAMGIAIQQSTVVLLLVWMGLGFAGVIGNVANFAHLGGLVAGAALGALSARR